MASVVTKALFKTVVILNDRLIEVRLVQGSNGTADYLLPRARYLNKKERDNNIIGEE